MPSASMSTMRACGSKPPLRPSAYFRVPGLTMPCRAPTDPRLPIPRGLPSSLPSTVRRSLPLSSMTNRGRRSRNSGSMYLSHRSRGSRMWPSASIALYARVMGNPSEGNRIAAILLQPRQGRERLPDRPASLLRGRREHRQLADVAHVVLDDDRRFNVADDLLHAFDRGDRLRAVEVKGRHAVLFVVLVEVGRVAAEQDRAHLLQPDQQRAMPRRVTRRPENDHAAVAEYVLVRGQRLDLPLFIDPALEARDIGALHRRRRGDLVPVALADEQRRGRERRELAGMVGVKVADADELHLIGGNTELFQAIYNADFRRVGIRAGGEAGVPHYIVAAVLDQVAAECERQFQVLVSERVAEAPDIPRRGIGAAVDACQRDFGRRLRHRR